MSVQDLKGASDAPLNTLHPFVMIGKVNKDGKLISLYNKNKGNRIDWYTKKAKIRSKNKSFVDGWTTRAKNLKIKRTQINMGLIAMFNKKIILVAIIVAIILTFMFSSVQNGLSQNSFWAGEWVRKTEVEHSNFSLDLVNSGNSLKGTHCSVSADIIDCAAESDDLYTLTNPKFISNNRVRFKFITTYGPLADTKSDKIGLIELRKIDTNTIEWKVINKPKAIAFVPDKVTLIRTQ